MNKCIRKKRFKRYMRETYKNKICALASVIVGIIATFIFKDITVLVFMLLLGIPLFLAKKNYIYD